MVIDEAHIIVTSRITRNRSQLEKKKGIESPMLLGCCQSPLTAGPLSSHFLGIQTFCNGFLFKQSPPSALCYGRALQVAAASTDIPDRFQIPKVSESISISKPETSEPPISRVSISNLSFMKNLSNPLPISHKPDSVFSSPPALLSLYQYAKLGKPSKDQEFRAKPSNADVSYRWHLPDPNADNGMGKCSLAKSQTVVVLLGWLGAKQRHLRRYAEWYTSRGFHVVTFTLPMADVVKFRVGGKVEESIELLANHLAGWVAEESGKKLVFHTFSNTGWLTYGVLLEKFRNQDPLVMGKIKGCIVDSAPVASPDPQVWASGFSAAFLKKQSVATRGVLSSNSSEMGALLATKPSEERKPAVAEVALLAVLVKFFEVVLNLPSINRRLHDVFALLSSEQPKCPQLYIYSSADRVIPAKSVESFIESQRSAGHEVRACDFLNSPHVDHFRSHPGLYTSQLTNFLEDYVLICCKDS
ncbi:uncharacterized protein A4U43_C07F22810 [Asparagus officinalis]|uniref:Transmembrane protein 53 n=1 Tax=Asparagus officinalis TaxID=4686 RepID=A0A5P1EH58_ASPOF|nr:uncharacterized protein A4U43_C07F22810 [Asparagus officinalis]